MCLKVAAVMYTCNEWNRWWPFTPTHTHEYLWTMLISSISFSVLGNCKRVKGFLGKILKIKNKFFFEEINFWKFKISQKCALITHKILRQTFLFFIHSFLFSLSHSKLSQSSFRCTWPHNARHRTTTKHQSTSHSKEVFSFHS